MPSKSTQTSSHRTQIRHFINGHKALTPLVVIGFMIFYNFWGVLAWVYLSLHGTYCMLWLIKDATFRDRRFDETIHPLAGFIFVFCPLGAYWAAPFIIISNNLSAAPWLIALSVLVTTLGIFYHYVSDAHKHAVLSIRKELITDGLFSRTRNPNYFGEMLIYAGFAILAQHWIPLLALAYWWSYFIRNMLRKDASMSRYDAFAEWKNRTGLVIPKII